MCPSLEANVFNSFGTGWPNIYLQGFQGCHRNKQFHGIVGQRLKEFEGLAKGQRIIVEHVDNDAHAGHCWRLHKRA